MTANQANSLKKLRLLWNRHFVQEQTDGPVQPKLTPCLSKLTIYLLRALHDQLVAMREDSGDCDCESDD